MCDGHGRDGVGEDAAPSGGSGLTRRGLLRGGGALALAVMAPLDGLASAPGVAVPVESGSPRFLTAAEMRTLRALVDRIVPGTPEDVDEGAVLAGCAEAVDALLGAFTVDPPLVFAGAPFSDRAGSEVNHFERFLPLDPYETKAWRLRIEGSAGRSDLEFNGPVEGYQTTYRRGLAALDGAAAPAAFADLPGPARDTVLRTSRDPAVTALVDLAVPHTLQLMYGAPEYGGNRGLVAWRYTRFEGDVQPRGYTREQVEEPDGTRDDGPPLPPEVTGDVIALLPLASPEVVHGILAKAGGSLAALRGQVEAVVAGAEEGRTHGS